MRPCPRSLAWAWREEESDVARRPIRFPVITIALASLAIVVTPYAVRPAGAPDVALAAAVTYTVNTAADTSDADLGVARCSDVHRHCSLRAAIMQANFHPGPDVVRVPAGIFKLTRRGDEDAAVLGDLDITGDLTLKGAGSGKTVIDANGSVTGDRAIQVLATAQHVSIKGLTIRHGRKIASPFDQGGGLLWDGGSMSTLAMTDVVVEKNAASYGGGIFLNLSDSSDSVDLNHVVIRSNTATAAAGGLGASLTATTVAFRLRSSHVYGNTAYEGGGVYLGGSVPPAAIPIQIASTEINGNHAGLSAGLETHVGTGTTPLTLTNDYVHGNVASVYGGGIGNYGYLVVRGTTISSNSAALRGGGEYAYAASVTYLIDTTVSANTTPGSGGGVYEEKFLTSAAALAVVDTTFGGNSAAMGGAFYLEAGTSASLVNTLLATGAAGANCSQALPATTSLSNDASCGLGVGDNAAISLSSLAGHGGRTPTQIPLAGSAGLDAGTTLGDPVTDQRGIARPQGSETDVGAVEVCQSNPAAPALRKPLNRASTALRRVSLGWSTVACVEGYRVQIRRGTTTGRIIQSVSGLQAPSMVTRSLARHYTYYWRVTAVGDRGSSTSGWRHFRVK
jgi:CSLREA domain-containing protein